MRIEHGPEIGGEHTGPAEEATRPGHDLTQPGDDPRPADEEPARAEDEATRPGDGDQTRPGPDVEPTELDGDALPPFPAGTEEDLEPATAKMQPDLVTAVHEASAHIGIGEQTPTHDAAEVRTSPLVLVDASLLTEELPDNERKTEPVHRVPSHLRVEPAPDREETTSADGIASVAASLRLRRGPPKLAELPRLGPPPSVVAQCYAVGPQLGQLGPAPVHAVKHLRLSHPGALVWLDAPLFGVPEERRRLLDELNTASRIGHPAILRVVDSGELADGAAFVVLDTTHWQTLRGEVEAHGPVSAFRALSLVEPVADALLAAHRRGLIHSTLSAATVILGRGPDGVETGLVAGFGFLPLVRRLGQVHSNLLVAPDLNAGDAPDASNDTYGIGLLLYELMAGLQPGQLEGSGLWTHDADLPRPQRLPTALRESGLPASIDALIRDTLSVDPDGRPQSMTQLVQQLQACKRSLAGLGADDALVGKMLDGRYRLLRRITPAGAPAGPPCSIIYAAESQPAGQPVSVHVVPPELRPGAGALASLESEALRASATSHPGIVRILGCDRSEGDVCYLVSEELKGQRMDDLVAMLRFTPTQALAIAHRVAQALEVAHRAQIFHRALGPTSLFIDRQGGVKLVDFGFANLAEPAAEPPGADGRADVLALGRIIRQLLAGGLRFPETEARPDDASSGPATEPAEPPLGPSLPRLAEPIQSFLATAVDPARSFASMTAMREALERVLQQLDGTHPRAPSSRTTVEITERTQLPTSARRATFGAIVLLVLAFGALLAFLLL